MRKINRCILSFCFSHLPSYGYIGEKQTRKIHLLVFLVCFYRSAMKIWNSYPNFVFVFLVCYFIYLTIRRGVKKYTYISFLSVFSNLPSYGFIGEKQARKIHLFIFLVYFSHLPCYGYIGEKQTRKIHLFIFLVRFFSSAFLRYECRLVWEKQTRKKNCFQSISPTSYRYTGKYRQEKYTYLSFLSVYHICLPTGTLRKTDKKIHLFVFLVCFHRSAI